MVVLIAASIEPQQRFGELSAAKVGRIGRRGDRSYGCSPSTRTQRKPVALLRSDGKIKWRYVLRQ